MVKSRIHSHYTILIPIIAILLLLISGHGGSQMLVRCTGRNEMCTGPDVKCRFRHLGFDSAPEELRQVQQEQPAVDDGASSTPDCAVMNQ